MPTSLRCVPGCSKTDHECGRRYERRNNGGFARLVRRLLRFGKSLVNALFRISGAHACALRDESSKIAFLRWREVAASNRSGDHALR